MTYTLTHHAARAHTDDLMREAARRRRIDAARPRSNAALAPVLDLSQHGLAKLRRVLSGVRSKPATP